MYHITFDPVPKSSYKAALLIKLSGLNQGRMFDNYLKPLVQKGLSEKDFIAFSLDYDANGKCPVNAVIKPCLANVLKAANALSVSTLYVADTAYFKALTGKKSAAPELGYVNPCVIKGYEHISVIYGINYQALFYDPNLTPKLQMSLDTLYGQLTGYVLELGANIIHSVMYPKKDDDIDLAFAQLMTYPKLTLDLEGFALEFYKTGIGTFAFSWDEHNGIAFECDYRTNPNDPTGVGRVIPNPKLKQKLKNFILNYTGELIYHNGNFDVKVFIYELFMNGDLMNIKGMLEGIKVMGNNFHDTKLITYLATNNTAGNELSLKTIAHAFAGNYAQDEIHDITKIPVWKLLRYNLIDCLATFWTYKDKMPIVIKDQQEQIYREIFLPSVKVILHMELTGMPIDRNQVKEAEKELIVIRNQNSKIVCESPYAIQLLSIFQQEECDAMNAKWKVKKEPLEYFTYVTFNPNSGPQLQRLIYEVMGYPVIDKTDTGQPSTGGDTIKKLLHLAKSDEDKALLQAILELAEVSIILDNFISNFLTRSHQKADGTWWLFGNFNLGGTVSGRLSSSKPNLQNIPSSGTKYAKIIKKCFKAPKGWIFVGADFNALEDRISALTTKDPNKIKIYTDGYDSHCLRAFYYFGHLMTGIVETVESINSIATLYKQLRQDSKPPTFLLTYQGTYHGLMANCGFDKETALRIEEAYHKLYVVSDEWVQSKITQACKDGYVTCAFGLRVRTPLLHQTILGNKRTPHEAKAESRTAGNALGQSYGLLNNRAAIEFQDRTLASQYSEDVLPFAHIHDAQYMLVRNRLEPLMWVNENLIECMEWQDLPEIQHPLVKLGGELSVFHPSWAEEHKIPNRASAGQILSIAGKM